ncbi:CopY/TcrY family copper transport repressor [Lactococcus hircilactis]|uniref:CopY/TcrY family copper transport repressor n=1 Tax=Lactococcus hircilactis TaxID=1494462 RepID=A0A7X2D055_9LACT|nr:CopY/TcrY family copper transport repressor [Lactococcus hircilactis]MQW39414.1 CopY/TcrY family copper transport repressor [Lactococcus hircilactis]
MEEELNISNAEMIVMRVIWSLGEARVDEITCQISKDLDWSLATVKTLLGRLVKKKMLSTEKEGRKFIYRPLMKECTAVDLMGKSLLKKVCATKESQLISGMIDQAALTNQDVSDLIEQLENKVTVAEVSCTCLQEFGVCTCAHESKKVCVCVDQNEQLTV